LLDTVKDVGKRFRRKQALAKKAAFLLYNIIALHPLVNGNKRTAYELVKLFLRGEAYQVLLDVASGKLSAGDVDKWVAMNLTEPNQE
jgi:prophage maintenance system killer protein